MKQFFLISLLALTASVPALAEDGLSIMKAKKERHKLKYEKDTVTMVLKDKRDRTKERGIIIWSMEDDQGQAKALIKFTEPQDVRNVGLLTWEQNEGDDDQWLFLPAQKRAKRIAAGGKKNAFMGTDLAYEDLRAEDLDAHTYNLTGSKTIDGHDCHVIEALPATDKEKRESGYSKRILYVRKDILFPVLTEMYDRRDRLVKTVKVLKMEDMGNGVWRANESIVEDVDRGTSTTMTTTQRDTGALDESTFTQRTLSKNVD